MSNPTTSRKNKYTQYKNKLTSLLRASKKMYYAQQFENEKNSIRNTWKVINLILNKQKSSKIITSIISEGNLVSDPNEIADCFNDYFTNIGPNLASNILPTQSSLGFTEYLSNPNNKSVFLTPVNKYEVIDIVNNLQNKKSSGHDSISMITIKNFSHMRTTYTYNKCFSYGWCCTISIENC